MSRDFLSPDPVEYGLVNFNSPPDNIRNSLYGGPKAIEYPSFNPDDSRPRPRSMTNVSPEEIAQLRALMHRSKVAGGSGKEYLYEWERGKTDSQIAQMLRKLGMTGGDSFGPQRRMQLDMHHDYNPAYEPSSRDHAGYTPPGAPSPHLKSFRDGYLPFEVPRSTP